MPVTYTIEHAKSGRAGCKKCKEKIAKDEIRIGAHSEADDDKVFTAWNHLECFQIPNKFKSEFDSKQDFLSEQVEDHTDDTLLDSKESLDDLASKMGSRVVEKKRKKAGEETNPILTQIQSNALLLDADSNEENDEPAKKKTKLSESDVKQARIYAKYSKMKVAEMQDVLKWNKNPHSGKKDALLLRIIDGETFGRLAKCPICIHGVLRLNDEGDKVECKGFWNEESQGREACNLVVAPELCQRLTWYDHDPSEEEVKDMEAEYDATRPSTNSQVPDLFLSAIKENIEWDTSSNPAIKKTCMGLAEYIVQKDSLLAIPEDADVAKIRKAIGPIVLENKELSMEEIVQLIVDKYGLKEDKEKNEQMKQNLVASICTVEANAGVYNVLDELSKAYYKEKNTNAGNTYKKVCAAIKDLDFEITVANAKGLGGGKKTKVAGIGKTSANYMFEFLDTGRLEKLEEKKAAQE